MTNSTRLGLTIAGVAVAAGILWDLLMREGLGLNLFLWMGSLVFAAAWLLRRFDFALEGDGRWLAIPLLFFAAGLAWRDAALLRTLDLLLLLGTGCLALLRVRRGSLREAGIVDYIMTALTGLGGTLFGGLLLVSKDIAWEELPRGRWLRPTLSVLRGLLIALPLLFLFGGLFMAADPVYRRLFVDLFDFDLPDFVSHLFLIAFFAWLTAGALRSLLFAEEPREEAAKEILGSQGRPAFSLGSLEMGTVLGALNLLFLTFVAVQFRYLFGGAALVEVTTGLSYAEYAREGFFELVTVAALVLPLLLLAHWLLPRDLPRVERLFRVLAGSLVAMLFVIMGSAFYRMFLYQQEFGLTELRLYVTAFMLWLAVVFLWFGWTVLRGQRNRFIFGALLAGYLFAAGLHFVNPDALIARTNLARYETTGRFDAGYAARLSGDAVPILVEGITELPPENRAFLAERLLWRWDEAETDWRLWVFGRSRALQSIEANWALLEEYSPSHPEASHDPAATTHPKGD